MALLGIDLILDQYRNWHILEVNDHPVGLYLADQLSKESPEFVTYLKRAGIDKLAEYLILNSEKEAIVLLLPDCFKITNGLSDAPISVKDPTLLDDYRIGRTLEDFNDLLRCLNHKNANAFIADITSVHQIASEIFLKSTKVGALYRRSSRFPKTEADCFCLNDLRLRKICPDKKQVAELLMASDLKENCLAYYNLQKDLALARKWLAAGETIIVKPEKGSASQGVHKITSLTSLNEKVALLNEEGNTQKMIFQKWIEPSQISRDGRNYYYDIRINILDGKIISGFGRCASAPCEQDSWSESPLVWLTTTGRIMPLKLGHNQKEIPEAIYLSRKEISQLEKIANHINAAVDAHCERLPYNETTREIGNFKSQEGIKDKIYYIFLE